MEEIYEIVHKKEISKWVKSSISEIAFAPSWTGKTYCEQYVLIEHLNGWQLIYTFGQVGNALLSVDARGDTDIGGTIKVIQAMNRRLVNR